MSSHKKRLDFLALSNSAHSDQKSPSTHKLVPLSLSANKKGQNRQTSSPRSPDAPPPIPGSPASRADANAQIQITMRKIELQGLSQDWKRNTIGSKECLNATHFDALTARFKITTHAVQYRSMIGYSRAKHKVQITELREDGRRLHIAKQTESGCPTVRNPAAKKGCWCIAERKRRMRKVVIPKVVSKAAAQSVPNVASVPNMGLSTLSIQQQLQQQQLLKQRAILNLYSNPLLQKINGLNTMNGLPMATPSTSALNIAQLLTARAQATTKLTARMQQIRVQQLLANPALRTQVPSIGIPNGSAVTKPVVAKGETLTTAAAPAVTAKNDGSVLGVRPHKDTIVFSKGAEPPVKKRKKSRWGS